MSKKVDLTKQLSEDDLRYLVDRCDWEALRENAANLGLDEPNLPSARGIRMQVPRRQLLNTDSFDDIAKQLKVSVSEPETDGDQGDGGGMDYNKLTVPQLKEELDKRKADYLAGEDPDEEAAAEVSYTKDDLKPALVQKLVDDDAAVAEASDDA